MSSRGKDRFWIRALTPLLVAVGIAGVSQPLAAADRYVRGSSGSDVANDCTNSGSPCATIQYAHDQAACGDTIHIHGDNGTAYNALVQVTKVCTAGNELTFQAWSGTGRPVIDTTGSDGFELQGAYIILDGLQHDDNWYGIWCNGASNVTIRDNIVSNNARKGFADPIADGANCDNVTIEDSVFFNNGQEGIYYEGDVITIRRNTVHDNGPSVQGIRIHSAATGTVSITDNTVYNQDADGIWVETTDATGTCLVSGNIVHDTNLSNNFTAIDVQKPSCTIKNNLVSSSGFDGILAGGDNQLVANNTVDGSVQDGIQTWGTGIVVRNNILSNNGRYGLTRAGGTDPTETYNLFYNNTTSDCNNIASCPAGTDITGSDPLFVNRSGGDFHLSQLLAGQGSDSPAIDAGSDTAFNLGLDTLTTRIDNVSDSGPVDMGFHYPSELVTNYRSIGTNTGDLVNDTGAMVGISSNIVTFGVPLPPPNAVGAVGPGDVLTIDPGGTPEVLYIISVDSPTQVTVQWAATIDHSTGFDYFIKRAFSGVTAIQDWETARQGDLVLGDRLEVGVAYKDGPFLSGATIDGSNTDPFHSMSLTVAPGQRHDGTASAGVGAMINSPGANLVVQDDYTKVEWLVIKNAGAINPAITVGANGVELFNLVLYNNGYGIRIQGAGANSFAARNCIVHLSTNHGIAGDGADDQGTIENCTLYSNAGHGIDAVFSSFTVTNTLSVRNGGLDINNISVPCGSQSYNMTNDSTACGPGSQIGVDWATQFVDIGSGPEDLHLAATSDAINMGTNLSAFFDNDVDDEARFGAWDIGADETSTLPPGLYRSVGVDPGDLNTNFRNVEISGTTATFSGSMPDNVGVGDVLTYNSGGNQLAFIHGRTSSTVFTVADKDGGTATATSAGTAVGVYRAYNSLADWVSQTENPNITEPTEDDVNPSSDLVATDTIMNVACYADGVDATAVVLSGWNTGVNNYIRIFTPTLPIEVGISQQHNGTWDPTKYFLEGTSTILKVEANHVRIHGLQVGLAFDTPASGIRFEGSIGPSAYEVSHSIIRGNGAGGTNNRIGLEVLNSGDGELRAWNNLLYDWAGGSSQVAGIRADDLDFTSYLYNNTVVDNRDGIDVSQGTVIASNNLAYNNGDNYVGIFDAAGTNNLSGPGTDVDIPTTNARDGFIVTFVNEIGDDFHLDLSDTGAIDFGADLSTDINLAFDRDIDREPRLDPWDIGADESLAGGPMQVISGSYTGDGIDNKFILVGFQPDVVVVKEDTTGEWSVMRTATMIGDASKELASAAVPLFSGGIKSLDPSGFTLGTDPKVNASGATHYWIAFKAGAGEMKVGSYGGDGNDDRSIFGVGFRPDYAITMSEGADMSVHRSSSMPGDTSYNFNQTELGPPANAIQAFEPDGFQVGSDPSVNGGGRTYHYVAWKQTANRMAVGFYTGDGNPSQILDIVGFQPEWLLVKQEGDAERWTMKPASTGPSVDYSLFVSAQPGTTDLIRALRPLGFEVGSRTEVNNSGSTYHWIAFAGGGDRGQVHYRWRNDDGDEVFATWAGPEDTPLVGVAKNTVRRLRFQVFNQSGVGSGAVAFQLQVAETGSCSLGTYAPVPIAATTEHWEIVDSPNIVDGEATTDVTPGLSNAASIFIPGEMKEAGNTTNPITLNNDELTEIEFVIQATSNATDGGDYCFRLFDTTNTGPPSFLHGVR